MVRINRVYTRSGDDGTTALGDGRRLPKFNLRVVAYGSIDEANAFLGLARAQASASTAQSLLHIQNDLFDLGADLCRPETPEAAKQPLRVVDQQVEWLEQAIDEVTARLEPLHSFILPGGRSAAGLLHVARVVVRRAEREMTELASHEAVNQAALRYVNRLSDLLFVLARMENDAGRDDVPWRPGLHRIQAAQG
ncbi:MAG: cob(I)yrinic acid a,c-diamide adenosyltransferase [Leifsonia xyli]|nr:MAG: cob(I)yrinic acid a,c-diamide adenosyltransferase [Leifsonia xyli]